MCKPAPRVVVAAVYDADVPPDRPLIDVAQDRRKRLRERLRAEWIAGAEEGVAPPDGPGHDGAGVGAILRRYPRDV
jgi:hypothetical protein